MTRKDIQFIAICVGAVALVVIAVHLIWPPKAPPEGTPIRQAEAAEYAYVASVNSEVFHQPNCRWAKQISERNLIGFKTREEVVKLGRRPCKVCKP